MKKLIPVSILILLLFTAYLTAKRSRNRQPTINAPRSRTYHSPGYEGRQANKRRREELKIRKIEAKARTRTCNSIDDCWGLATDNEYLIMNLQGDIKALKRQLNAIQKHNKKLTKKLLWLEKLVKDGDSSEIKKTDKTPDPNEIDENK